MSALACPLRALGLATLAEIATRAALSLRRPGRSPRPARGSKPRLRPGFSAVMERLPSRGQSARGGADPRKQGGGCAEAGTNFPTGFFFAAVAYRRQRLKAIHRRRQNPPALQDVVQLDTAAGMRLFSALQETNPPPRPQGGVVQVAQHCSRILFFAAKRLRRLRLEPPQKGAIC